MFFFNRQDINAEVETCRKNPEAVLVDVREADEYQSGHIPGAVNLPLSELSSQNQLAWPHSAPVFIYCLRGTRSRRAVRMMKRMGYQNVKSIGGIASYTGQIER